jgi:hypothetical protein
MKFRSTTLAAVVLVCASPARCQHNVQLTWLASPDAPANPSLTYNVYRSPTCNGSFTKLNSAPVVATSFTDTNVVPGSYCYQVTSLLSGVEGAPSNQSAVVAAQTVSQQQASCPRKTNLVAWLRCARTAAEAHQKRPIGRRPNG